jgi:hypothetical protein
VIFDIRPRTGATTTATAAAAPRVASVPPAVLKLHYLEREIQLQSQAVRPGPERAAVNSVRSTWAKVRPWLVQAGGARVATAYDAHVRALGRAAQPAALQKEAAKGHDLVGQMESVFLGK